MRKKAIVLIKITYFPLMQWKLVQAAAFKQKRSLTDMLKPGYALQQKSFTGTIFSDDSQYFIGINLKKKYPSDETILFGDSDHMPPAIRDVPYFYLCSRA